MALLTFGATERITGSFNMLKTTLVLLALLLPACPALALAQITGNRVGDLEVVQPWSMELPPNAPTVAAYFVIRNNGKTADTLTGVESPVAGSAQFHEHISQDGLMKMQQVQSVEIPAGGSVVFAPMAYHFMLLDLKDKSKLVDGQAFPLALHFETSGDINVDVPVLKQAPEPIDTTQHNH